MKRFCARDNVLLTVLFAYAACGNGPQTDRSASVEDSVPPVDGQAESARLRGRAGLGARGHGRARRQRRAPARPRHAHRRGSLVVHLVDLANSPCPEGVTCVWEGVGLALRYEKGDQVDEGMNRVKALGYAVTILATDYETCAVLRIDRDA